MTQIIRSSQSGFTLVQIAIVVAIVGIVVGSSISLLKSENAMKNETMTDEKLKKIAVTLSDYALRTGRIPCPGDPAAPSVEEMGSAKFACDNTPADRVGLVPFTTLGLKVDDVMDGFGNPISYAMVVGIDDNQFITTFEPCRTATWVQGTRNLNTPKAGLCCSPVDPGMQLNVHNNIAMTTPLVPAQNTAGMTATTGDTLAVIPFSVPGNLTYTAYVLTSHGKNGLGAFVLGQALRRDATGATPAELENTDDDTDFIDLPEDGSEYDDKILWRTQESMVSELGNNSCARP